MLKVDSILPVGGIYRIPVSQVLLINYDKNVLEIPEWIVENEESDLKINHLDKPKHCDFNLKTNRLIHMIELYEAGLEFLKKDNITLYPQIKCENKNIYDLSLDSDKLSYISQNEDSEENNDEENDTE
jgi:hypothetical protein